MAQRFKGKAGVTEGLGEVLMRLTVPDLRKFAELLQLTYMDGEGKAANAEVIRVRMLKVFRQAATQAASLQPPSLHRVRRPRPPSMHRVRHLRH